MEGQTMLEHDLHSWLVAVLRNHPRQADIDDCLSLLGALSPPDKRRFWIWLSQHDPNLKTWLKQQRRTERTSIAVTTPSGGSYES